MIVCKEKVSEHTPSLEKSNCLSVSQSIKVTGTIDDNEEKLLKFTPVSFITIDTTINIFTDSNVSSQMICRKPGMYMIYITGSRTNTGSFINIKSAIKGIVYVGRQRIEQ